MSPGDKSASDQPVQIQPWVATARPPRRDGTEFLPQCAQQGRLVRAKVPPVTTRSTEPGEACLFERYQTVTCSAEKWSKFNEARADLGVVRCLILTVQNRSGEEKGGRIDRDGSAKSNNGDTLVIKKQKHLGILTLLARSGSCDKQ